jgi:minor extracellular serine protease Vpr
MGERSTRFVVAAMVVALTTGGGNLSGQIMPEVETGLWFVELETAVDTFRARAKDSRIEFSERYVYQRLWRGLSVQASEDAASAIGRLSGVKAVYPVLLMDRGPVDATTPELIHALAMTGADLAQSDLGLTGAGVKVGVIDSGIDYHHPDLGGGFGPGYRVVTGYDFVGDRYNAAVSGGPRIPHPDNDPDDCDGHGTHVAGIIGASGDPAAGGALGVAPGVTFGAYRVFGCEGVTTADIVVAAMERALADGMHVVNMSLAAGFQTWPQYPTSAAADALVDAGVVVVAAIGNNGANGVYSAASPGVGRKVIGVASFENSHIELPFFTVSPGATPFGYLQATAAPAAPTTGDAPLARTGTTGSTADACLVKDSEGNLVSPLPSGSLAGHVALIRRGTCTFYEKSVNAEAAGAVGVVLYNNAAGFLFATVAPPAGAPPVTIPVVTIQAGDGAEIDGRIAAGPTTLTWTGQRGVFANPTSGRASPFSSYGLTAELALKPNLGAPGGFIRSTLPLEIGGYGTASGTSMASPHVAGAVALYLEAHPTASPAAVQTALQNSADPVPFSIFSNRDAVHLQGAGMVDIDDAITATTTVTPSELSVGEGTTAKIFTLTIANEGADPVTYALSHVPALMTHSSTFAPGIATNAAAVGFSAASVDVPGGESASFNVSITPPGVNRSVYGGSLVVSGGGRVYRVPYAGFAGDYQSIQVLAPGGCPLSPFPGIFKRGGETVCVAATETSPAVLLAGAFTRQTEGALFNVEDRTDRPVILYHRAHQSRRLEIRAINMATNESHLVAFADYLTRNATNGVGGFFTYTWDGKRLVTNPAGRVHRSEVPEGSYQLQIVVTKALAEPGNPAHIETWNSPTIYIARVAETTP